MSAGIRRPGEGGFTVPAILLILVVLALIGTSVFRNVRTDARLTGINAKKIRAELLAESAVTWALAEVGKDRGHFVPFTKATHDPSGQNPLANTVNGIVQGRKLLVSEVDSVYAGSPVQVRTSGPYLGWIYQTASSAANSIAGQAPETIQFKVWYPSNPANTLRISAMGMTPTDTARVEFTGTFNNIFVPCPAC